MVVFNICLILLGAYMGKLTEVLVASLAAGTTTGSGKRVRPTLLSFALVGGVLLCATIWAGSASSRIESARFNEQQQTARDESVRASPKSFALAFPLILESSNPKTYKNQYATDAQYTSRVDGIRWTTISAPSADFEDQFEALQVRWPHRAYSNAQIVSEPVLIPGTGKSGVQMVRVSVQADYDFWSGETSHRYELAPAAEAGHPEIPNKLVQTKDGQASRGTVTFQLKLVRKPQSNWRISAVKEQTVKRTN